MFPGIYKMVGGTVINRYQGWPKIAGPSPVPGKTTGPQGYDHRGLVVTGKLAGVTRVDI